VHRGVAPEDGVGQVQAGPVQGRVAVDGGRQESVKVFVHFWPASLVAITMRRLSISSARSTPRPPSARNRVTASFSWDLRAGSVSSRWAVAAPTIRPLLTV